ncbi:hypothetical protein ACOMHN_066685 [Nucella lapillus]
MKNFDDTYAAPFAPGYWNKPLANSSPKTAGDTHGGGYRLAQHAHGGGSNGGLGGRGGHSETSSLYSRYTASSSTRSERKRSRKIALCVVLTILALILAILLGLLVYFLFINVGGVQGSVRVLNMTYHDDMANTSSEAFRQIAQPFCEELDSYVSRSNYSDQYEGCEVVVLK